MKTYGLLPSFFQDQYSGIRTVFKKAFLLLRSMARHNEVVQRRLFDRLDMLLSIEGADKEMAAALTEVGPLGEVLVKLSTVCLCLA